MAGHLVRHARRTLALAVAGMVLGALPTHGQVLSDFLDAERARESYHAFLELAPADDPRRADALRRLADLELERAEELLLEEERLDAAQAAYGEAIRLYAELVDRFPDRAEGDVVLYQLARAHDQRGEPNDAVLALSRLVTEHPDSPLVDEAWFRQGEAYFLRQDFDLAADAYGQVLAIGDVSDFFDQALYKQGWSLFREARYEDGTAAFWHLAGRILTPDETAYSQRAEDDISRAERELLDDAIRAMSISFSYLEGVDSLTAFLATQPKQGFEHLTYAGLGDLYLGQERFNDAAITYDAFSVAYPEHREAPVLQLRVIDTYVNAGFSDEVLAAKEAFAERYALTAPFWTLHAPAELEDVVAALKVHLTDLTEYYHARAQAGAEAGTDDSAADYETATYWYRQWLASFPAEVETPGKRFLLAELLFEQQRFAEATEEYERTAYEYGDHMQAAEAGYAALLAYDREAERLGDGAGRDGWRRQGVDSALRFAVTFPTHAQAVAVQTRAAEDLFAFGEYAAASDAAVVVTTWDPPAELALARTAWTVVGYAQFELADYLRAEQAYQQVLALDPEPQVREDMTERLAASVYRQGEAHRDAGDLESAVEDFLRVAQVAPDSSITATADYDASAALIQLEQWERAATALNDFRARHPDHEYAADVTRKLATAYLATGDAAGAAVELERVARTDGEPMDVRIDSAWNATNQYEQSNNPPKTLAMLAYLSDQLPVSLDERVDAQERTAATHQRLGNGAAELTALRRLVDIDAAAGANRSDRSRSAAAGAALKLADVEREQFERLQLTLPIQESLTAKRGAMESTLDAYTLAAGYGIADVSTASAYRIADLYLGLGRALMDSERPRELSELELEQYEFLLEEQAFPFEEQAIELHEANARRTVDGVFDEWVQASLTRLAELVPARYAKAEKGETLVSYID
ncbi:MAG: tetratricopeptide repeat protein [Pseudomonadota bacterium]